MKVIEVDRFEDKGIQHGFFTKQGGVSEGIYESLNCGKGSDDDTDKVKENRARVAGHFGQSEAMLCTLYQNHSDQAVIIKQPEDCNGIKADALVTDQPHLVLGILTADCGPILFSGETNEGKPVIGAAHAGWKGAIGGILENTVLTMREIGAQKISAAIGPCIGPKSYEVSAEFTEPFLSQDQSNERFFKETNKNNKLMFDLPGYIASRLALLDLNQVIISGHDTYAEENDFFSYRRKTHRSEPDYGRQISAIIIK
ncbi:MAG: peptidoglycan editing factor PgeF [Pseudomonadota bacterium]